MDDIYFLRIAGVSHYQKALENSWQGEAVHFVHEPDNPYDCMALRIENSRGKVLGYVPRTSWLRAVIHERGRGVAGAIASIGLSRACILGATISVSICGEGVPISSYYPDKSPPEPPPGGFRYWVTDAANPGQRVA